MITYFMVMLGWFITTSSEKLLDRLFGLKA